MGNGTDGLIVTQARHEATIHNLENAPFGFDRSIGGLVEKTPHLSVTFRGAMTGRLPRTFLVSRTDSFGFDRGIGGLVEKTPHLSVTFRGAMTGRLPRTFLVSRTDSYPRAEILVGSKRGRLDSYFG